MIVRPRPHWFAMLFVLRGSVVPVIVPQLLWTTAFAVLVTVLHGRIGTWKVPLNFVPFSLIGLTLAIFLGFRNGTSYARWWEARTLWGSVLNETRTLLRQALTLPADVPASLANPRPAGLVAPDEAAARAVPGAQAGGRVCSAPGGVAARQLAMCLIAFVHAMRHQLRGTDPAADLARLLPAADCVRLASARFRPALLLLMMGEWLGARLAAGALSPPLVQAMEVPLGQLTVAIGGCERIASTPIPFTYALMIHRTIFVYCLLLPFGLVDAIGAMTPVIVVFIAYTFFALEALGAQIEEPFGLEPNDLALDEMSLMIEHTLLEMLGEPPPSRPAAGPPGDGYIRT